MNTQDLQISEEGDEHAEIARLAFTRPLAVSPVSFGWSKRAVRVTLIAHRRRIEMACAGCERRRAKLKKLMELANERLQILVGAKNQSALEQSADREPDGSDHTNSRRPGR